MGMTIPPLALADMLPRPEGNAPQAGTVPLAARPDHVHQRLAVSLGDLTLNGAGSLTINYADYTDIQFDKAPSVTPVAQTPAAGTLRPTLTYAHIQGGGIYTGVTITGSRPGPITVGLLNTVVVMTEVPAANAKFGVLVVKSS